MSADTPDLNEELRQFRAAEELRRLRVAAAELERLRAAMAAEGLGPAGHKRAAELLLADAGRHITEDPRDMRIAEVTAYVAHGHALLAAGSGDEVARLENELAAAQDELQRSVAARADQDEHLRLLHTMLADADSRAGAAQADAERYRAQTTAVTGLCQVLRQEGLAGVARRIEAAMGDADIAVAKQRGGVPRTADGRVVPPPGPVEIVAPDHAACAEGPPVLETAERLVGRRVRIRKVGGCGAGEPWDLLGVDTGKGVLRVTAWPDGEDEIPLVEVKTIEPLPTDNREDGR